MSRGQAETASLRENIEKQLDRLMKQLAELEEVKDDLDDEEYVECKEDTLQQLKEFNETLSQMKTGDMSLVDDINAAQLAIQAAISQAFRTPEIMKMFAQKDVAKLRLRLSQIPFRGSEMERIELLTALKSLGEELSAEETMLLQQSASPQQNDLVSVSSAKVSEDKVRNLR
ncbi:unnamed protein product [Cyprideis torosa]|uniref:Beta-catenin-interacting ICAT domain-containing protein n=1 Tax=Cyprideis torosa TaxID=163714 RepID=A0A7R8W8X7_9CRUS|nr:unnamed protein product [Cyprideis torosa]CAG0889096.1 unnamed protein product [Cyprideis torosa]